jgi:hypothetical protein
MWQVKKHILHKHPLPVRMSLWSCCLKANISASNEGHSRVCTSPASCSGDDEQIRQILHGFLSSCIQIRSHCLQFGQDSFFPCDWLRVGQLRIRSSSPGRVKDINFSISSTPTQGSTQPPIQLVSGVHSLGIKRQGCETDHLPPTSIEVKKMWIYANTPHTSLWCRA